MISNETSGDFTLTANLSGQTGVIVAQGNKNVVYSDAVDIKNAVSSPPTEIPVGTVSDYAGTTAPDNWLLCYGQAISRTTYGDLFAVTGTTSGVGDGSTTFNVPDLRGRVVAGQDDMGGTSANRLVDGTDSVDGDTLGDTGGVEFQTVAEAELPSHTHTGPSHTHTGPSHTHSFSDTTSSGGNHNHSYGSPNDLNASSGGSDSIKFGSSGTTGSSGSHSHTVSGTTGSGGTGATGSGGTGASGATGSGTPMAVLQPTIVLNKIIFAGV